MADEDRLPVAAVLCPGGVDADALIAEAAMALAQEGRQVVGLFQRPVALPGERREALHLEDPISGLRIRITQDLGHGASGCSLDPRALAAVAGNLLARLDAGPVDVVIVNRFGKAEAEGEGLRAVIERACERGIPVLAALRPGHREAWDSFTAGEATLLPAESEAILGWLRAAMAVPADRG